MKNNTFASVLSSAFPTVPESFHNRINQTIILLKQKDTQKRKVHMGSRTVIGIAASFAAALILVGCVFTIRPALAAEIPVVNTIVYTLAPTARPNDRQTNGISETVRRAVSSMILNDREALTSLLHDSKALTGSDDLFLALSYFHWLGRTEELTDQMRLRDTVLIETTDISGDRKAFRYTMNAEISIWNKDSEPIVEPISFTVTENAKGFYLDNFRLQSPRYTEFVQMYAEARLLSDRSATAIEINTAYFCYLLVHKAAETGSSAKMDYLNGIIETVEGADLSSEDKAAAIHILDREKTAVEAAVSETVCYEDLAAELMMRYHRGRVAGVVSDFWIFWNVMNRPICFSMMRSLPPIGFVSGTCPPSSAQKSDLRKRYAPLRRPTI